MENILKDKCKSLRCIEWKVRLPPASKTRIVSEKFLLQNKNCNLEFYTGCFNSTEPHLRFDCNGELQLPIKVTLLVVEELKTYSEQIISITNESQKIWSYTDGYVLSDRHMSFELIFHADYSGDEKSVQTPSYLDTHFLVDSISPNFSKLLNEGPCHDLEFICGEQTMKAHKSILSCRSDMFASMLQSDMVEGKTGRVAIKDMEATLFREFLRYLYTGILPTLTVDIGFQFYEAGDKYNINSLKKQCADFLTDNLSLENAYDILIVADRHNDLDLKRNVVDYMIEEKMPFAGDKWNDFCKDNPILAVEVLNSFCQHNRSKLT